MKRHLPLIISTFAVVAMCGFIFFMSARPADESGAMSMEIVNRIIEFVVPGFADLPPAEQLVKLKTVEHIVRKIAHFSEYAILGMLALNLVRLAAKSGGTAQLSPKHVALAWALATAYAVTDEVHQIFVPGRSCMFTDVLIDSAGVLAGALVFLAISSFAKRRTISRQ